MAQSFNPTYSSSYYTLQELAKKDHVDNEFRKEISNRNIAFDFIMGGTTAALSIYGTTSLIREGWGFWNTVFCFGGALMALGSYSVLREEIKTRRQFNQDLKEGKAFPQKFYLLEHRLSLEETVIENAYGKEIHPCTLKTIPSKDSCLVFINHLSLLDKTQRTEIDYEETGSDEYGSTTTTQVNYECGELLLKRGEKSEKFHFRCRDKLSPDVERIIETKGREFDLLCFTSPRYSGGYFLGGVEALFSK